MIPGASCQWLPKLPQRMPQTSGNQGHIWPRWALNWPTEVKIVKIPGGQPNAAELPLKAYTYAWENSAVVGDYAQAAGFHWEGSVGVPVKLLTGVFSTKIPLL